MHGHRGSDEKKKDPLNSSGFSNSFHFSVDNKWYSFPKDTNSIYIEKRFAFYSRKRNITLSVFAF